LQFILLYTENIALIDYRKNITTTAICIVHQAIQDTEWYVTLVLTYSSLVVYLEIEYIVRINILSNLIILIYPPVDVSNVGIIIYV
jgi:hypothetical protein